MSQLTESTFHSSNPVTSFNLFYSLSRGQLRPGQCWDKRSFRRKFIWRSLLIPHLTREWMTELAQWPDLDSLLTRQPRLPVRLHRPYLAANFDRKMRLDAVRFHYHVIRQTFLPAEFKALLSNSGLQLAQIKGKDDEIFTVTMMMFPVLDKEGESTILVQNGAGDVLTKITFTFCEYHGKSTLLLVACRAIHNCLTRQHKSNEVLSRNFPKTDCDGSDLSFSRTVEYRKRDGCQQ